MVDILDCTLRDGGYVNGWDFSFEFGCGLYGRASEAGCKYVEIGYVGEEGGMWADCDVGLVEGVRGSCCGGARIAVMVNFGKSVVIPGGVDMVRLAVHKEDVEEGLRVCKGMRREGLEVAVNFMGISNYDEDEVGRLIELICKYREEIDYFYLADSYGSLLPREVRELVYKIKVRSSVKIGFHGHNNLQLALANSIEAMDMGVSILDGSVYGMGRGGGNLNLEVILGYMVREGRGEFKLEPILEFVDLGMREMRERYEWGYGMAQMLSGMMRCHPKYVVELLKCGYYRAEEVYYVLSRVAEGSRSRFSEGALVEAREGYEKVRCVDLEPVGKFFDEPHFDYLG